MSNNRIRTSMKLFESFVSIREIGVVKEVGNNETTGLTSHHIYVRRKKPPTETPFLQEKYNKDWYLKKITDIESAVREVIAQE